MAVTGGNAAFEERLDRLRTDALETAVPSRTAAGYYGLPLLKPPVWKWMIPVYFFVGGLAGMSAVIAGAALLRSDLALARAAMLQAAAGAAVSTVLLVWDLGRPARFLHMLRVFKLQSPMSLGSWILTFFGAAAAAGWLLLLLDSGGASHGLAGTAVAASAVLGAFLATYTGALLAATAVPAWYLHRGVLPVHFGVAGLGSAAGLLELLGHDAPALHAIGYAAAAVQTLLLIWLEVRRHGVADRALRTGRSGLIARAGESLEGPVALVLRVAGTTRAAAAVFLLGALVSRFGWLAAGRASALDPEAVLDAQRRKS